jgi:8-oxo-dGTP pyrophosphatase MutT (NUDIX family)
LTVTSIRFAGRPAEPDDLHGPPVTAEALAGRLSCSEHVRAPAGESVGAELSAFPTARSMAPGLSYGRHFGPPAADHRRAAVMMLLYPNCGPSETATAIPPAAWRLPLTVRPQTLAAHPGQVSFPGGMLEPGETVEQAAVRELVEELGPTAASGARVLGALPPVYVYVSNFLVTPLIAVTAETPRFVPSPDEVAEVFCPRLGDLAAPEFRGAARRRRGPLAYDSPHFLLDGRRVWGATAIMLGQLIDTVAAACRGVEQQRSRTVPLQQRSL